MSRPWVDIQGLIKALLSPDYVLFKALIMPYMALSRGFVNPVDKLFDFIPTVLAGPQPPLHTEVLRTADPLDPGRLRPAESPYRD